MKETLEKRCQAFIESRDVLKKTFRMESSYLYPVCANIFCAREVPAEEDTLRRCHELLKSRTGIFSNFRGTARLPVLSLLAASGRPEEKLGMMLDNYRLLKEHFFGSQYLALVAMLLADAPSAAPVGEVVARGRQIYDRMRQEHPFLTSGEDSVFAVLLAQSDKSNEWLIADMEDCYQRLKTRFHSSNDVQAVSHVLALAEGAPIEKAARLIALYDRLRAAGCRYSPYRELSVLAALSTLPLSPEEAEEDLLAADAFLSAQKGYGIWSVGKKTRLMHAAMLVAGEYAPQPAADAAAMGSTLALIAAQQAAMCAVIAASSAHHASST